MRRYSTCVLATRFKTRKTIAYVEWQNTYCGHNKCGHNKRRQNDRTMVDKGDVRDSTLTVGARDSVAAYFQSPTSCKRAAISTISNDCPCMLWLLDDFYICALSSEPLPTFQIHNVELLPLHPSFSDKYGTCYYTLIVHKAHVCIGKCDGWTIISRMCRNEVLQ